MTTLVVAAHPDDEALGCGGTIRRLADAGEHVEILFLADGESSRTGGEVDSELLKYRRRAACAAAAILGAQQPRFADFPDNRLDTVPLIEIVQAVESAVDDIRPDTVYTHHAYDLNIDHGLVSRAVVTACRPLPGHSVERLFAFEVLSSTEWQLADEHLAFVPDRFVNIAEQLDAKLAALEAYAEEMRPFPHSRSYEAVRAQATLRGAHSGLTAAEAFRTLRMIER